MKIIINGKEQETQAATIKELAASMNLPEKGIAIAVCNTMIPRTDWEKTSLEESMHIIIISAACGG